MLEKIIRTPTGEKIIIPKQKVDSVKIIGTLTSQIQLRGENTADHYYYAFVKLKGQSVDLPVIFKVEKKSCRYCEAVVEKLDQCNRSDCGYLREEKRIVKPNLKKGDPVELFGHYSNSPQSIRKSFTCLDYQLLERKSVSSIPKAKERENILAQ